MLMKMYFELKIDINSKNQNGRTAFHLACINGTIGIVDMMIENMQSFNLDLEAKDNAGKSGFQLAKIFKKFYVVNLIKKKMPCIAF